MRGKWVKDYFRAALALMTVPYLCFHLVLHGLREPIGKEVLLRLPVLNPFDAAISGLSIHSVDSLIAAGIAIGIWWLSRLCYLQTNSVYGYTKRFTGTLGIVCAIPLVIFWICVFYLGIRPDVALGMTIAAGGTLIRLALQRFPLSTLRRGEGGRINL